MEITSWKNWKESLKEELDIGEIDDIQIPENYMDIWRNVSLQTQLNKAQQHNLSFTETQQCFQQLSRRPHYLTKVAETYNVKNIVEIGTAQGLQSISFAEYVSKNDGHVWTCDIQDVRNKEYFEKYENCLHFNLGDSSNLKNHLKSQNILVDMFYIDGAHDKGDVLKDVENLREIQSENPLWVFDDLDTRFGCFEDIKNLCEQSGKFKVYRVGNACSGLPNHQAIIVGKL